MDSVATDRATEGRSSTRYAKHVIHRPLLALRCLRLTTAVLCLARPVFAAGPSPSTLVAIRDGLKLEENAAGKLLVLDTMLAPSMGDCSSSSPCWPVEGGSEPMLPSISSQNSLFLLSRNAHGKVAFGNSGSMNTRKQLVVVVHRCTVTVCVKSLRSADECLCLRHTHHQPRHASGRSIT